LPDEPSKRWVLPAVPLAHSLPGDVPSAIAKVLANRGVTTGEQLRILMDPPQQLPYNPQRMSGMDQAVARLHQALTKNETVAIFGDFDVDGVTGTAILGEGLGELGISVLPYLPHRLDEGHGLSGPAVQHLVSQGVTLIITVDTGVTAVAEVAEAHRLGADVIITDHHVPQPELPAAVATLDPNLPGCSYPFNGLCGAGLAFKLMQGMYQFLGQPWNPALLELAALGTIADLVPLVDENRFLVQQGLIEMSQTKRPGLLALFQRARVEVSHLDTEAVSFQISPRLNSAGRMGHAEDSYRLLTTRSAAEAEMLAGALDDLNRTRREASDKALTIAFGQIEQRYAGGDLPPMLFVGDPGIVPGVAGLVAGRLAEAYRRPTVAMSMPASGSAKEDTVVASGRSIPQFNIEEAFGCAQHLLVKYGGHSQAAGFTVTQENLPQVIRVLSEVAERELADSDLRPALEIDAEVRLSEFTEEAIGWLSNLEPFGKANPRPLFLSQGVEVLEVRTMGNASQHVKLSLGQEGKVMTALAFNQAQDWPQGAGHLDIVYSITADWWRGVKSDNLKVVDVRPSSR
jgi:single-stranded-DNA-specific exonuclease